MITIHHLNDSRSQRVLWMLEELGVEYRIEHYARDAVTRLAPDSLKKIHPLGKSPVIQDGDMIVAESAAAIDYLSRTYGKGKFSPTADSADFNRYNELMHYAEGSAMLPLMLGLYVSRLGEAGALLGPRIQSEQALHLGYLSTLLGEQDYFMGDAISAVDVHTSFILEAANMRGPLKEFPNLVALLKRLQARPAYQRALEAGGPYSFAA